MLQVKGIGYRNLLLGIWVAMVPATQAFTGRLAVTADGNYHDIDDWAATPVTCAMIAAAGLKEKLVHYDYNNHIAGSDKDQGTIMKSYALGAAERFGLNKNIFFDDMSNLSGSIANIAKVVNASSASDPLTFIMAGPPEVLWRGLNAADAEKRKFVTVISHSNWNNNPHDTKDHPNMQHVRKDVEALGVKWKQIQDQNRMPYMTTKGMGTHWDWMKDAGGNLAWVYSSIARVTEGHATYAKPYRPDFSDAGMMFYVITGEEKTDMDGLKSLLLKSAGTDNPPKPTPEPEPEPTPDNGKSGNPFLERNGYIVIEMESVKPASGFVIEKDSKFAGFLGSGYYRATANSLGKAGTKTSFPIRITKAGKYRLELRSRRDDKVWDAANDVWVGVNGSAMVKLWYASHLPAGKWSWASQAEMSGHVASWQLEPGDHTIHFASRSAGYRIDRLVFYTTNGGTAKGDGAPESPRASGTGTTSLRKSNPAIAVQPLDGITAQGVRVDGKRLAPGQLRRMAR